MKAKEKRDKEYCAAITWHKEYCARMEKSPERGRSSKFFLAPEEGAEFA